MHCHKRYLISLYPFLLMLGADFSLIFKITMQSLLNVWRCSWRSNLVRRYWERHIKEGYHEVNPRVGALQKATHKCTRSISSLLRTSNLLSRISVVHCGSDFPWPLGYRPALFHQALPTIFSFRILSSKRRLSYNAVFIEIDGRLNDIDSLRSVKKVWRKNCSQIKMEGAVIQYQIVRLCPWTQGRINKAPFENPSPIPTGSSLVLFSLPKFGCGCWWRRLH